MNIVSWGSHTNRSAIQNRHLTPPLDCDLHPEMIIYSLFVSCIGESPIHPRRRLSNRNFNEEESSDEGRAHFSCR